MTKTTVNRFRKRLTDYSLRAQQLAGAMAEQARTSIGGEAAGNLSNAPMHLGDVGSEMFTQEMNATIQEHEEYVTREIVDALERIDRGTFGVCENCQAKIPNGRLEVLPQARFCVQCAELLGSEQRADLSSNRLEPLNASAMGQKSKGPDLVVRDGEQLSVPGAKPGRRHADVHAVGTAGGGTAVGGLGGTNIGHGDPAGAGLEEAMGSGDFDARQVDTEESSPQAGRSGGAVGGTPAGKRAKDGLRKPR